MPSNELLEKALIYARFGWKVFPCHCVLNGECSCGPGCSNKGKHPRTKNGLKDATGDENQIRQWWDRWPSANIAVATGPESGIWVWDADLPEGPETTKELGLPVTKIQRTGSGGLQYFFEWNGTEIHNSAKMVAPGIDIRGLGGYVILPPSTHESGDAYRWENKEKIAKAPGWLTHLVANTAQKKTAQNTAKTTKSKYELTKYGQTALANELVKLSCTPQGHRNQTLNTCAFCLAQLVAGGELEESVVKTALLSTAVSIGLAEDESRKTIESGFKSGSTKPREAPESNQNENNHGNHTNHTNHGNHTDHGNNTISHDNHANITQNHAKGGRFGGNITGAIRDLIQEYQGAFTNQDIDRELGLTDPADRTARRRALLVLVKERYIKRDIRIVGKYHTLKSSVSFIDFDKTDEAPFEIEMPLDLTNMVSIPKKSIVVLAGSTNSGKTTIAIDFLKRNLYGDIPLMYLMSEMGPSEYKQRIKNAMNDDHGMLTKWKERVMAADLSSGFDTAIAKHNQNGLTVIDFLEEVQGEYFKIASDIRSIYDALGDGVALVCLQKHSKAYVGRGGEATAEKPRLYLSIDQLVHEKTSTISAVKIYKAKEYPGENPNGLERHISIINRGSEIVPITDWMYCNPVQRGRYVAQYEALAQNGEAVCRMPTDIRELPFVFKTTDNQICRLLEKDVAKWRNSFKNIDVDTELAMISLQCDEKPFMTKKNYFFQLCGILRKKNEGAK